MSSRLTAITLTAVYWTASLALGDCVRVLDANADAIDARIRLIDQASKSIDLAYFEVDDSPLSRKIFAHLRQAVRRGVRVRLLVDAYCNELSCRRMAGLIADGLLCREYHGPRWLDPCRTSSRLHDKLLIVDGAVLVVGGRNLAGRYFGLCQIQNFRDRDVMVSGPAACHAAIYFERMWSSDDVKDVPDHSVKAVCLHLLEPPRQGQFNCFWEQVLGCREKCKACFVTGTKSDSSATGFPSEVAVPGRESLSSPFELAEGSVRFLHSNKAAKGCPDITNELLALIASARRRIVIETPYLILTDRMHAALAQAAARGVCVEVTTNSMASTNVPLAQAGYLNQRRKLIECGISLWEYQGADVLHSKSWVVDDAVMIGSYNLDSRSELFDTQTAVLIRDVNIAEALLNVMINERAAYAVPVGANGKPLAGFPEQRRVQHQRTIGTPALKMIARCVWLHL